MLPLPLADASGVASGTPAEKAPTGECEACHTPSFKLKPASHETTSFYPAGHAELAKEADKEVVAGGRPGLVRSRVRRDERARSRRPRRRMARAAEEGIESPQLKTVEQINECSTCHAKKFCIDCHGLPMPHPPTFKKEHGTMGKADPEPVREVPRQRDHLLQRVPPRHAR